GMVVPARRFDLDVLANQVEAEAFAGLDIGGERFVGWRGIQTVRPPALIEQSVFKERLAVEKQSVDACRIALYGDRANPGVALDLISPEIDAQVVQKRLIRGPQFGLWHTNRDWLPHASGSRDVSFPGIKDRDPDASRCSAV